MPKENRKFTLEEEEKTGNTSPGADPRKKHTKQLINPVRLWCTCVLAVARLVWFERNVCGPSSVGSVHRVPSTERQETKGRRFIRAPAESSSSGGGSVYRAETQTHSLCAEFTLHNTSSDAQRCVSPRLSETLTLVSSSRWRTVEK